MDGSPDEIAGNKPVGPKMSRLSSGLLVAAGIAFLIVLGAGYLHSFQALGFGVWTIAAVILGLCVISYGALATTEVIPFGSRDLSDWLQYRVAGSAVYALALALLSGASLINLFSPDRAEQEIADMGASELLENGIPGVWGERGCDVTYDVTMEANALVMRSLKSADGMSQFSQTIRLGPPRNLGAGRVEAGGEVVLGPDQGSSITLQYERIAEFERLTRIQGSPVRSTSFDRC